MPSTRSWRALWRGSLKTRVTAVAVAIFVASLWTHAWLTATGLGTDMRQLVGQQQLEAVGVLVADVNQEIEERLQALDTLGSSIPAAAMGEPASLVRLLQDRPLAQSLFNGGVFIVDLDGKAIASVPLSAQRVGVSYADRAYIQAALKEGRINLGDPVIGRALHVAVIPMAAPIRDPGGRVIGAIAGITDLSQANFLGRITQNRPSGSGGSTLVVSRKQRMIITSSDPRRAFEALPPRGVNAAIDRYLDGAEGTSILTNPLGTEVLVSVRQIPSTEWYLASTLPTDYVFAPVRASCLRSMGLTLALTLAAGLIIWLVLRRQLAPLADTASLLSAIDPEQAPAQALPITRHDEIGQLIGSFNQLLNTLTRRGVELQRYRDTLEEQVEQRTRELAATNEQLRSSEQRFALALAATRDGLWDWNIKTDVAYVSPAYSEMLGYQPGELGDTTEEHWLGLLHPDEAASVVQTARARLEQQGQYEIEFRLRCKDGSYKWVLSRGQVVERDAQGQPLRAVGTHVDLSARKQLETDLREAKQAAEVASVAKSAFLANMSHEIRTPLNAIAGMAHLIRHEGLSPTQEDRMDKLQLAATHLTDIIDNVLDLSKIEAGKMTLESSPFELGAAIGQVVAMLGEKARARHLTLRAEVEPPRLDLIGDRTRLQQAVLNYAGNAIKFTEQGGVTLRTCVLEEDAATVLLRVEVSDTGIGIDASEVPRLFSSFEQADSSTTRKYGGTGLGLAITRKIAGLMGGDVGVRSALGEGSTFWFTARLSKGDAATAAAGGATGATVAPSGAAEAVLRDRHAGARVLLADDEPVNREITSVLLEDVGLRVDTAEDGLQAVEKARAGGYALILMDMQMPGMDGLDATREIRKLAPDSASAPILAMTANAFSEDRARCLAAGMDDFLVKPLLPDDLYAAVLRWLESGRR